jgi:hypothetical protein
MSPDPRDAGRVPRITAHLAGALARVVPSCDQELEYRPCRVKLRSGEWRDRVYVQEATSYLSHWGIWPWEDRDKDYLPLDDVVEIDDSPTRIPAHVATSIYAAGESGMGYCIFTLVTADGRRIACMTGNAVDWVDLPSGVSPRDVVDVSPQEGRDEVNAGFGVGGSRYAWCLYRT